MKRILRLVKKFRAYRKEIRRNYDTIRLCNDKLTESATKIYNLSTELNRLKQIFRYEVDIRPLPDAKQHQICIRLTEKALKYVRDPENMIQDVAREMVTKLLR